MNAETHSGATAKPQDLRSRINPLMVVAMVIIVAIAVAWQWYDTRNQITGLQQELNFKIPFKKNYR